MKTTNLDVKTKRGRKCASIVWILRFELKAIFGGISRRSSQMKREGISRYPPHCFQPWIGARVASPQSPILRPSKNNFNKNYFPRVDKPVLIEGVGGERPSKDKAIESIRKSESFRIPAVLLRGSAPEPPGFFEAWRRTSFI